MRRRSWLAVAAVAVHAVVVAGAVAAQAPGSASSGAPTITADRGSARVGEQITVTLERWPGRVVTVSVCGNQALRGSQDCNMVASEAESLNRDGSPTLAVLPGAAPPMPCPCVLRASSRSNGEVAFAPIEIVGHPTGPLVEPAGFEPLDIDVRVHRADTDLITGVRSALGGPTPYDVTVTVQNRSGMAVPDVAVSGAVGRGRGSDSAGVEFPPAGELAPGQTWTETARVTLPAPAVGKFVLTASASGGGPAVEASDDIRRLPWLLVAVVVLFGADVTAIAVRRWQKRHSRDETESLDTDDDPSGGARDDTVTMPIPGVPILR